MPDYDDPTAGGVSILRFMPDFANITAQLPITDPGQIGAGNLPDLHGPGPGGNQFVTPDARRTVAYPSEAVYMATGHPTFRLGAATWDPYIFRESAYAERTESGGMPAQGTSLTGAPAFANMPDIHGPITEVESEALANLRQPTRTAKRSWVRQLLMLPPRRLDPRDAFDERVIPATGRTDVHDTESYRGTDAAVSTDNAFVIPDVRRTFDQPKDAPLSYPRDADGNPITDKAGYTLTDTRLEPQPWAIHTSHKDVSLVNWQDENVQRPRAGAALPAPLAEDSNFSPGAARPATVPRWIYTSPFDQWAARRLTGQKGRMMQPLIDRPIFTRDEIASEVAGTLAPAGGPRYVHGAPGMDAIALLPNTDRTIPQPWDYSLIDTGSTSDSFGIESASSRASGWRL